MARLRSGAVVVMVVALAAVAGTGQRARACMLIGAQLTKVRGEEVLITWDRAHHREHFVRHLSFDDASPDFGFLVPTPSRPELGDVDDRLFFELFLRYHAMLHGPGGEVRMVDEQRVAGLDATVLEATSAHALDAWLTAHHYPSTPALEAYLAPYVQRHYFVTAFRYVGGTHFGTRALRMSFDADVPYFPYAEPVDAQRVAGRVFRISVVSDARVEGRVGSAVWSGRTRYAGPLSRPGGIAHLLPAGAIPPHAWLTTFQENESVRGRDDLLFVPSASTARVASTLNTLLGGERAARADGPPRHDDIQPLEDL